MELETKFVSSSTAPMQTMTSQSRAKLASDYLLLYVIPPVLTTMLKSALTPGGDDEWDWEKLTKKLVAEQISYLLGMMVIAREFAVYDNAGTLLPDVIVHWIAVGVLVANAAQQPVLSAAEIGTS